MTFQTLSSSPAVLLVVAALLIGSGLVASPARAQEANRVEVELTEC